MPAAAAVGQSRCVWRVTQYQGNVCVNLPGLAGFDKCLHVRATAGDQYDQPGFAAAGHDCSSTSLLPALIWPICQAS